MRSGGAPEGPPPRARAVRATSLSHARTSVRALPTSGGPSRAPVPARAGTAAALLRRRAGPAAARAWAAAEPPGGDRARLRPRPRGGPRRRPGGRADAVRPHGPDPGRRHGRRPGAAGGGAGGGDLSGRDQARDRPPPHTVSAGGRALPEKPAMPGERIPAVGAIE